jgi:hypothetical protein
MVDNKLLASTLSYLNGTNYIEVSFKKKIIADKRKTKYSFNQSKNSNISSNISIMSPRSIQTLLTRVKLQAKQTTSQATRQATGQATGQTNGSDLQAIHPYAICDIEDDIDMACDMDIT